MTLADPIITELQQEYDTTRRVLATLPEDRYTWSPHEKSLSLGRLARHVAELPSLVVDILSGNTFDFAAGEGVGAEPTTRHELLEMADTSVAKATGYLSELTDDRATTEWRLSHGDSEVMRLRRISGFRSFMLNHIYHHRGQLSVYLRLLDVPVPSVYGPTADENPFA